MFFFFFRDLIPPPLRNDWKIVQQNVYSVSSRGLLPEILENNSTGICFGESPLPVGAPFPGRARARLLPGFPVRA